MQAIKGKVTFEHVDPDDLASVAGSITGRGGQNVYVGPPGAVDQQLAWALADLKLARNASNAVDRDRCATNAIMSARRSLACLVDWYLKRDCFSLCRNAPRREKDKAELLSTRGLFDEISSDVLYRAIEKRNEAEHQYRAPTVEMAEDVFELMRRTIQCLSTESNPSEGPILFGQFSYSTNIRSSSYYAEFFGWQIQQPCFLLCSFDATPWLGAILPQGTGEALVRRTLFNEITTDHLLRVLQILENTFGRSRGYLSTELWRLVLIECGIIHA
jgi:hypothetical protein